jgi:cytochrome b6-f complex iron-sulfur subunit
VRLLALAPSVVAVLLVLGVLDLFAILYGLSFMRARKAQREADSVTPGQQLPKAPPPITRRDFFRRSLLVSFFVFLAEFGGASIAFLWPNLKGGFGSTINAGSLDDIRSFIQSQKQPYYVGVGRFYVWFYGSNYQGIDTATGVDYTADGYVADGFMAIYQRCAHLGCRVPFCTSSQWFECPCHGSKYNIAGEYQLGPAPQGLQRFAVKVENNNLIVDTSGTAILGPPRGTDTVHEPPQGPFCV